MRVKFTDLGRQYRQDRKLIIKKIDDISKRGQFILGSELTEFERKFAKFCGTRYALGLNSGSDALFLSLLALNFKRNSEIIIPALSFTATAWAVVNAGYKPIFCEVDSTLNMSMVDLEKKITSKTQAIIPVHLTGKICDVSAIKKILKKKKINRVKIIEDAAQSFGATLNNNMSGSFGFCAGFSLHPLKNLNVIGDGGVLVTNNKQLYQKVKLLRNHGLKNNISQISGYNSRLDNIQAAVANIKLSKIKKRIVITRKYADIYNKILKYLVQVPLYNKNEKPVFHRYIILCQNKKERDTLYHFLKQKGIETKINYGTPLYDHPAYKTFKYKKLSTAESIGKRMLSLPLYPEISQNELNHVIRSIKSFFRKAL